MFFQEESDGHAKALCKHEKKNEEIFNRHRKHFKQDVTLYERMKNLRVTEGWD